MRDGFEVVVCGGGTAGSVVAARLAEAGSRVLVLEAGPDYGPADSGRWPAELLDASTIPVTHDWGLVSEDARRLPFERAKVIGGCSAHNGCTISWGHRADYDGWGLEGWSADELLSFLQEASRRLRVRRFAPDEVTPFHAAFLEAGMSLGFPKHDLMESLEPEPSVCLEPSNSPDGVRWNTAFAYLDPVRELQNLEIRSEVTVDRVLIEDAGVIGVRAIGPEGVFEVAADLVVLAGGTYGSPAVLLRSGIGPAGELAALGIETMSDLPGVSRNLHDHPAFELFFAPSEELERRTASFAATGQAVLDEQGFAMAMSSLANGVIDLHVFPEVAMDRRHAIFVACLTPRSRGSVRLADTEPFSAPRIDHAYLTDPDGHDLTVLRDGAELARRFSATSAMAPLFAGEIEPGPVVDLDAAIRRDVIHYWHPVGTCAMGDVTDERGRVRGVDGLVVADASLMPETVRATTNLPTVVVAERIASSLMAAP